MKAILRSKILAGVLAVGGILGLGSSPAKAQGLSVRIGFNTGGYYGGGYNGGGYYGGGYYGSGYNTGGYYGSGYNTGGYYGGGYNGGGYNGGGYGGYNPGISYYGNGGHDLQPHLHTTQTPAGSFNWYGNGAHDLQPHLHTQSVYGGYQGYSPSPFGGVTTSYYNSTPYTYMPW